MRQESIPALERRLKRYTQVDLLILRRERVPRELMAASVVGRTREPARSGDLRLGKADRAFSKHFQDFRSLHKRSASRLPGSGRSGHVAWLATPCDGDAAKRIHEGLTRGVLVDPALLGETEDELPRRSI